MISRFFKKKPSKPAPKAPEKKVASKPKTSTTPKPKTEFQKILTAEGWRRLMMKKYSADKKK